MLYLGIDVGKRWHEAALLDDTGTVVWRLRFAPTKAGLATLGERLAGVAPSEVIVGLEATGVYWLSAHAWLLAWGAARVFVLNPLQTKAFRNANLRGSKTGRIDAVAIGRLLRWERRTLADHVVPEARQQAARELGRLRVEMIELRAQQLVRLGAVLDRCFPEFAAQFSDVGSKTALAVLDRRPTPATLTAADLAELTEVLRHASRGHTGAEKAVVLQQCAAASVGVSDPLDAAAIAVRTLVGHLEHLAAQIHALGTRLDALLAPDAEQRTLLASVPGVGVETIRTWLSEAPPIERFQAKSGADKLVAQIGLDARIKQSGRWVGQAKMSKRGNRYLRRALMLAAENAARSDPQCRAILRRQLTRRKHYRVAVSHVAHKLAHVIYSVLLHRKPYELPPAYRLGIIDDPADVRAAST